MLSNPTILVFDSGLGGLTVHSEIVKLLPIASTIYLADDAAFPYGRLSSEICAKRVLDVIGIALERFCPDIVVIACNTASTVALPDLRARYAVPFVGTVPAVKPAAAQSRSKMISILGTPGTVSREYTHDLIIQHAADCRVTLVGAPNLARLAEAHLRGETISEADVLNEIAPCFKEKDGARTDAIALACTHYPLLLEIYRRIAPWDVAWIDPAPAIARRVSQLLEARLNLEPALNQELKDRIQNERNATYHIERKAFMTSADDSSSALSSAFASFGLTLQAGLTVPFNQ